jgi:hypothetical protein
VKSWQNCLRKEGWPSYHKRWKVGKIISETET